MSSAILSEPELDLAEKRGEVVKLASQVIGVPYTFLNENCVPDGEFPRRAYNCGMSVRDLLLQAGFSCPEPSPNLLLDIFDRGRIVKRPKPGYLTFVRYLYLNRPPRFTSRIHNGKAFDHVGVFMGGGQIVHASQKLGMVVCESWPRFCGLDVENSADPKLKKEICIYHVSLPLSREKLKPSVEEDFGLT